MPLQVPPGELDAGPYLDRLIELRVFARKPAAETPPYSTDDAAAERVIAQLNRPPLRWMAIRDEDGWTFSWRQPLTAEGQDPDSTASTYVRLLSASASTRALAICRAAIKLLGSKI